jgi:sulfur-carrier protein
MPQVVFTANLQKHVVCPIQVVPGNTVRAALTEVFSATPQLRGYILDDQGKLREHVVIFIDGEMISDRISLSDTVRDNGEIYVMQALSGG